MIRPAWLVASQWTCSYCGQRLGIVAFGARAHGRPGWTDREGIGVWSKPHHKDRPQTVMDNRTGERVVFSPTGGSGGQSGRGHTFDLPAVVVCKNPDCGESVLLSASDAPTM